jgi:flagellar basal-body rod protein FlgB
MSLSIDRALSVFDDALALRAKRGEVLASNLVNADTPNYKARDFDFQVAFDRATTGSSSSGLERTHQNHTSGRPLAVDTTHANHLALVRPDLSSSVEMAYRIPAQDSLDGNTVDVEHEKVAFAENALHYQAAVKFLNSKITSLKDILKGN